MANEKFKVKFGLAVGDTAATVDGTTGNIVTSGTLDVQGGTITDSTGALSITTGAANGNIILDPDGTGDVVMTFANGGNITNNRNYVHGAIRNATTETTNGGIWELNTSAAQSVTNPYYRGLSLSNSADTTRGPATLLRSYSGGPVAGSASRGRVIFEKARGFPEGVSTGPTAVQANDILGGMDATGYTSTGWLNDTVTAIPATSFFQAAESWVSNTNLGTTYGVSLAPTNIPITTGANLIPVLSVNPQTSASRSDAFTWANGRTGTTQTMSLDVSGNLIVTGDVRINGNNILGSGGLAAIDLTSANTLTTIRANGTLLNTAADVTYASISSTGQTFTSSGRMNIIRTTPGTGVLLRQQTANANPVDGEDTDFRLSVAGTVTSSDFARFDGTYKSSGDNEIGLSVSTDSFATDTDRIYIGSRAKTQIQTTPAGGGTTGTTAEFTQLATTIKSDQVNLQTAAGVGVTGNKITYNRVYGQFEYGSTVTPAAANTAYVFPLGTATFNNIVSVGSTSRLIIGAAGIYNFQFSVQCQNADNANDHEFYIWLKKNGTDVAGSTGRMTLPKTTTGSLKIVGWNFVVDSANTTDYYELAYAVSDTDITFPSFGALAFAPGTSSLVTTITPIGA